MSGGPITAIGAVLSAYFIVMMIGTFWVCGFHGACVTQHVDCAFGWCHTIDYREYRINPHS